VDFAGCAVVISHDRWFLDRIATHILAFEGDSKVYWCEGNYQTYEEERRRRLGIEADQPHRIKYKALTRRADRGFQIPDSRFQYKRAGGAAHAGSRRRLGAAGPGQFLLGVTLHHATYRRYSPDWDHDHCSFCGDKFMEGDDPEILHEGYTTDNEYHW